ncbi:conserved hypothetical protein [Verticillium alfalfae VaMs.102]|uniref:Alpha-ketoglutarate-dependent sulfonate dioxygenase n=1 Tax=Verticillium alfalfae (strain VaMs.102 / ATCC MYA-4576 / FGSC 10136) TaxID=526221 RepID=C9SYH9_VERA1|nr:conserved hypothetical protein [Verticillium alfalfae VaMs.102]EEY23844.1 conserved hypothetical protein [Verticillium alfalfae VaMs.102]
MPSFFKRFKDKEKEAQAEKTAVERPATPPPAYGDASQDLSAVLDLDDAPPPFSVSGTRDITAAFASLKLSTQNNPDVDSCLAHLKLLHAIQTLKEEIGYTDGLWDIWDHRAGPKLDDAAGSSAVSDQLHILSIIREKRWALYLARAVDRYEAWWTSLPNDSLTEKDMETKGSPKYERFPEGSVDFPWTQDNLPPIDVLMIWHTHMLNPRVFLEDAMRRGLKAFWTTGMPWAQVNIAIDNSFNYTVTDECKAKWERTTGRAWLNQDDPKFKSLECPACHSIIELPWTTCGLPELYKGVARPGLHGNGFGDGEFSQFCTEECGVPIDKQILPVARFIRDAKLSVENSIPMPGSVLDPKYGTPNCTQAPEGGYPLAELSFPDRLAKAIYPQLRELIKPGMTKSQLPTMKDVANIVGSTIKDEEKLRSFQNPNNVKIEARPGKLIPRESIQDTERYQCRKMMGQYWQNPSMFGLDLAAGAIRQGVFIDKMYKIDWLHSPSARSTMTRLLQKYDRFFMIMLTTPGHMIVPTLDVDLAWHTHQLAPRAYYNYSTSRTAASQTQHAKFIDHNDKVEEGALGDAFVFTCRKYMNLFNEVYSECTCWFCEAVRDLHSSAGFAKRSKAQKGEPPLIEALLCVLVLTEPSAIDELHRVTPPLTDKSTMPHMSTHNAVSAVEQEAIHWRNRSVRQHSRHVWNFRLNEAYTRAAARAKRRGITLPPKEVYYNHWGKDYYMLGPHVAPTYLKPGIYYADDPGRMPMGKEAWAQWIRGW